MEVGMGSDEIRDELGKNGRGSAVNDRFFNRR
jgi:hypothetical protein